MIETKYIKQATNIFSTELEEELVLLNQNDGKYYTLNGTGKLIWEIIEKKISFDELVTILSKKFQTTSNDEIYKDTLDIVSTLLDKELLEAD